MSDHGITRRDLLRGSAVLPALYGVPAFGRPRRPGRSAIRNVIFMVSDGMSAGVPSLAEPFSRMVRGTGTAWQAMADRKAVTRGYLETASADSMVTDSAAAASAWGSGLRVANGAINVRPDGHHGVPLASLVRASGRRMGLVTTTTVTHATPAGFAAVHPDRYAQAAIAPQYLDVADVVLGGGEPYFRTAGRNDGRDLVAAFTAAGYDVCTSAAELARSHGDRVLGLFADGHLPYTIDRRAAPADHARLPTLSAMTRSALERMTGKGNGFFLLVEGGRVDHAAHANDAAALLWEQLDFDDAIAVALEFVADDPGTLLVVTTDHGNANPGLNGIGARYEHSTRYFERLAGVTASFETMHGALSRAGGVGPGRVISVVHAHTGCTLATREAEPIALALAGKPTGEVNHQHAGFVGALGQALANHVGIAWTGISHTSEIALTMAAGPGADRFAGVMHHADAFDVVANLLAIPTPRGR